jgi:hypothetical protein
VLTIDGWGKYVKPLSELTIDGWGKYVKPLSVLTIEARIVPKFNRNNRRKR